MNKIVRSFITKSLGLALSLAIIFTALIVPSAWAVPYSSEGYGQGYYQGHYYSQGYYYTQGYYQGHYYSQGYYYTQGYYYGQGHYYSQGYYYTQGYYYAQGYYYTQGTYGVANSWEDTAAACGAAANFYTTAGCPAAVSRTQACR